MVTALFIRAAHHFLLLALLEVGVLVALSGVVLGGLLDYLALRKTHLT
ncbi:hypothetical protein ABH535_05900 [Escherichia coli]